MSLLKSSSVNSTFVSLPALGKGSLRSRATNNDKKSGLCKSFQFFQQKRGGAKLVICGGTAIDLGFHSTYKWGFEGDSSSSISNFEANTRLLTYASMYSGILQVNGAEEPAKEIFNACIQTCEKLDHKMEGVVFTPLKIMNEYVQKLQKDSEYENISKELQHACEYAQDRIVEHRNFQETHADAATTARYLSDSQQALSRGLKIALFLSKLGGQLQAQGYESEAQWLYQNVHQMERKILQHQSMFMLSNPVHEVTKMLLKRTDDEEVGKIAKCVYAGAIEFWDSQFGPNHPDMYTLYVGLAEIILDLGECDNKPYNTQDRIQHLAEYIQQKHRGTGVLPDYYI